MPKHAIFLSGPIGSGKTTLGVALAHGVDGAFIDGDDYADPDRPWYGCLKQTCNGIMEAGFASLATHSIVVVAYPLGCATWIYFRRKFGDAGVTPVFVSLRASYEGIVARPKGRQFTPAEHERIKVMIREGYGERPFSDLVIDTDATPFAITIHRLTARVSEVVSAGRLVP